MQVDLTKAPGANEPKSDVDDDDRMLAGPLLHDGAGGA